MDSGTIAAGTTTEHGRIGQLEAELSELKKSHERLRRAYTHALEQLQLMRRRMFVAKAERTEAAAEQLAFDGIFAEVKRLEKELETLENNASAGSDDSSEPAHPNGKKPKALPKGRRNLAESDLPTVRVEVADPELEGKAERIGVEESYRLAYERGGMRRVVVERVVYKMEDKAEASSCAEPSAPRFVTAPPPKELFRRALLAPSMVAHLLLAKYVLGVPFYRLEQQLAAQGASLDRGTMCRYAEDAGATLGAIVEVMRAEAFATAFCLSTDATGVRIQPGRLDEGKGRQRGPCDKGHFFVVLADKDHVFFEYQRKHTSAAVCDMFQGFSGYIQADAHAVYDALFRGEAQSPENAAAPPIEVGCWSHARRKFWEAAVCKYDLGVEGLRRINGLFEADRRLADLPPSQRKARRDQLVRPLVDIFFAWAKVQHALAHERGLVATALGYAVRQESALRRFLDDGRLRMENNGAERAIRPIASARKSWMFFGSDDHAGAAANIFSLVASCKLHRLETETYFADVMRVMPYWPRERYLELAPKYWAQTRLRLNADELAAPLGHITVPPTPS